MAFSADPSLTHVPVEESYLLEVYRSASTAVVKMTGGRPCEAFICTSRKQGAHNVFVSFLDTVTRNIHVLTPASRDVSADIYRQLLDEAKCLLGGLGFTLEQVNLDFSPAIRQVVVRDIRVMHPPPSRNRVKISRGATRESPAATGVAEKPAKSGGASAEIPPSAGKAAATDDAAASGVAALRDELFRLRREMLQLEKEHQRIVAELQAVREEKRAADEEVQDLQSALVRETVAASRGASEFTQEKVVLLQKIEALEAELAEVRRAAPQPSPRTSETEEIAALRREMDVLAAGHREELQLREAEYGEARQEAENLRGELLRMQERYENEADVLRRAASDAEQARRSVVDERETDRRSNDEELTGLRRRLAEREEQIDRLRKELELVRGEAARTRDEARFRADAAEAVRKAVATEADALRDDLHRQKEKTRTLAVALTAELEALRKRAAEAQETLLHLQEEHRRLTVERPTLLAAARKAKRAQVELERLRAAYAEKEAAFPAQGMQRETAVREAAPDAPTAAAAAPPEKPGAPAPPEEHEGQGNDMSDALALLLAEGAGYPPAAFGTAAVGFRIDSRLHGVEYHGEDDVIAVYEAMNHVQAMPDGRGLRKCGAYICVVRREGVPRIHNVWTLADEGGCLVALPDRAESVESFESILKDALFYYESVGFIMEPLDLGNTRQKRARALARVPVLRKAGPPASGGPAEEAVHAVS